MRFRGGGVGHRSTSSCNKTLRRDVPAADAARQDVERVDEVGGAPEAAGDDTAAVVDEDLDSESMNTDTDREDSDDEDDSDDDSEGAGSGEELDDSDILAAAGFDSY